MRNVPLIRILIVNLTNYSVTYMGKQVDMPPKELELLYFLASSPNQVFTREQLLDHIWGYEYIGDTRTVDVHIKRLREKIKDHPNWSISTVWGIGYKFEDKKRMRKTVHSKLICSYIFIGIVGFLFATAGGSHFVETYLEEEVAARLYDSAVRFASDAVTVQQVADNDSKGLEKIMVILASGEEAGY